MAGRTFAIGDIHGETQHLQRIMSRLPELTSDDTLVFLGDYIDRGHESKQVVQYLMKLPSQTKAQVVCLRGNHEDAWLRVCSIGWNEFLLPSGNGCLATYRSFTGGAPPQADEMPRQHELMEMATGACIPDEVLHWMQALPFWYEDEHAIYVHAGLPRGDGNGAGFLHPTDVKDPLILLWIRTQDFSATIAENQWSSATPIPHFCRRNSRRTRLKIRRISGQVKTLSGSTLRAVRVVF